MSALILSSSPDPSLIMRRWFSPSCFILTTTEDVLYGRPTVPSTYRDTLIKELTPYLAKMRELSSNYYTQKQSGVPPDPRAVRIAVSLGHNLLTTAHNVATDPPLPLSGRTDLLTSPQLLKAMKGASTGVPTIHAHVRLPPGLDFVTWKGLWLNLTVPAASALDYEETTYINGSVGPDMFVKASPQDHGAYSCRVAPSFLTDMLKAWKDESQRRRLFPDLMVVQRYTARQLGSKRVSRPDVIGVVYTFAIADTAGETSVDLTQLSLPALDTEAIHDPLSHFEWPENESTARYGGSTPSNSPSAATSFTSPSTQSSPLSPITADLGLPITTQPHFDFSIHPAAIMTSAYPNDFDYYTYQQLPAPSYPDPYPVYWLESPSDAIPPAPIPMHTELPMHMPKPQQQIVLRTGSMENLVGGSGGASTAYGYTTGLPRHPFPGAPATKVSTCPPMSNPYLYDMNAPIHYTAWHAQAAMLQQTAPTVKPGPPKKSTSLLAGWNKMDS